MRTGDDLFFAPGIKFSEVDLDGHRLPKQYRARIDGFYLEPARVCIKHEHAFAAGLLLTATIDFLAGMHHTAKTLTGRSTGRDFKAFVRSELPSFAQDNLAERFYREFRNGLTHEARIKEGSEFSFNWQQTVYFVHTRLCINPAFLLKEVESAIDRIIDELLRNDTKRANAATRLRTLFTREFEIVEKARPGAEVLFRLPGPGP